MVRSYRGLGLVVLMLLVVAPLTLFAVLSLFEDESADSIKLSLDGEHWTSSIDGALLDSEKPWTRGEVRTAIVYVRNSGPAPVDADVAVACHSTDQLVRDGYVTLTSQVDRAPAVPFPADMSADMSADMAADMAPEMAGNKVVIDDLAADSMVPVTLSATFVDTAPIGATIDSSAVRFEMRVKGARSEDAGPPSLLDAAGAQLWLAPILLVVGAGVALRVQARRGPRPPAPGAVVH